VNIKIVGSLFMTSSWCSVLAWIIFICFCFFLLCQLVLVILLQYLSAQYFVSSFFFPSKYNFQREENFIWWKTFGKRKTLVPNLNIFPIISITINSGMVGFNKPRINPSYSFLNPSDILIDIYLWSNEGNNLIIKSWTWV